MKAVNLLPEERRAQRRRPGTKRAANPVLIATIALAVIAAAVLGAITRSTSSSLSVKRTHLVELQDRLAALPRPKPVGGELASAPARLSAVTATASQRLAWDAFLGDFSKVVPEDVWLLSLQAAAPGATPAPTTVSSSTSTNAAFTLSGYTYGQKSVARLMTRLALVPWLSEVQLQSSSKAEINKRTVYQFTLGATIVNPGVVS